MITASSDKTARIWYIGANLLHNHDIDAVTQATARAKLLSSPDPLLTLQHLHFVYAAKFLPRIKGPVRDYKGVPIGSTASSTINGITSSDINNSLTHPQLILTGGYDGNIRVWLREGGLLVAVLTAHSSDARASGAVDVVSLASTTLNSSQMINEVSLFGGIVPTGNPIGNNTNPHSNNSNNSNTNVNAMNNLNGLLLSATTHSIARIQSIAVSPTGTRFYTADARGRIKVWEDTHALSPVIASTTLSDLANWDPQSSPDLHEVAATFGATSGGYFRKSMSRRFSP